MRNIRVLLLAAGIAGMITPANAQGVEVTAQASVTFVGAVTTGDQHSNEGVVLWLTPVDDPLSNADHPTPQTQHYQLAQKNKQFIPHVLVIPVGSVVEFPNQDPFFHNVFSLFNGKRFDLGLYESGSTRSVHFDRAGASYIFCNIHPEMSAVVVAVPTHYYAVSSPTGNLVIHGVASGTYVAHIWAMGESGTVSPVVGRRISISGSNVDLGAVAVTESAATAHKNKFGENYEDERPSTY